MESDFNLLSVYDIFEKDLQIQDVQDQELLFGEVISESLPLRGKAKCIKLGSIEKDIKAESLPHLKYSAGDKWWYLKDGKYAAMYGITSGFKNVQHLEENAVYAENIIRLRIVIELLKKNVRDSLLTISDEEYKKIGFIVLRSDPSLVRASDSLIIDGVNNWIPSMVDMPLYADIPRELRGRTII